MNALQIFQVLRFSTTLLIGIVLIKVFGLSTAEISLYEILLFLGNFVSFFWISAGQKGLLSLFPSYAPKQQAAVLFNIFLVLFLLSLFAALGLYFGQSYLIPSLTQYQQLAHIQLLCIYLCFVPATHLTEYIYLLKKEESAIIRYGLIVHGLQLCAVLIPISVGLGIAGIFKGLVLWSIFKFAWLIGLLIKYAAFSFDWLLQKQFLALLLPLGLHALLGGGMEYIDGFIVTSHFENEKVFALFRYGARELPLVSILVAALVATLIPLAVEKEQVAISTIKKEIKKLSLWLYPLTILLMLLSPFLYPLVYNEDFTLSAKVFNIYLLVISSRVLLPQVLIYSRKHNYILVLSAIIELLVNLSLSLYLVRDYGLEGIAFATVIAYLVNKILLISYNYYQFGIPITDYLDLKSYIIFNILLFVIFWATLS